MKLFRTLVKPRSQRVRVTLAFQIACGPNVWVSNAFLSRTLDDEMPLITLAAVLAFLGVATVHPPQVQDHFTLERPSLYHFAEIVLRFDASRF
jgi:hypothetical protein